MEGKRSWVRARGSAWRVQETESVQGVTVVSSERHEE